MIHASHLLLAASFVAAPALEPQQALAGKWWINGNGHVGELFFKVADDGKVDGTIYNVPIKGTFDSKTKRVTFKRFQITKLGQSAEGVQEWTGVLSEVPNVKPPHYQLEGTFKSIADQHWGELGVEYAWKGTATRLPSPAEELKQMQGHWIVAGGFGSLKQDLKLPAELRLNEKGNELSIEGNLLLSNGKLVATLTNDLASKALEEEKGFPDYRILMLTLRDGRGLLCSYTINDKGIEIAYPHTTSCHRGSGQIVYLNRPTEEKKN